MIIISIILFLIAAMCSGLMDDMWYHWDECPSWMHDDPDYWNPKESWQNSVVATDNGWKPKHFGSTTFLKPFYSGWHLLKAIQLISIIFAISILYAYWVIPVLIMVWWIGFYLTYNNLLQ